MSYKVTEEILDKSRARYGARNVLTAIAETAHHDGVGWLRQGWDEGDVDEPSARKTIAWRAGLHPRQVRRCQRTLQLLDELEVLVAWDGRRRFYVYRIIVGRIRELPVDYARGLPKIEAPFWTPDELLEAKEARPTTGHIVPWSDGDERTSATLTTGQIEPPRPDTNVRALTVHEPSLQPSAAAAAADLEDLARRLNSETVAASLLHELEQMRAPIRIRKVALAEPDRVLAWIETARSEARTNFGAFVVMGVDSGEWPVRRDPGRQESTRAGWAREVAPLLDAEHVDLILEEWREAGRLDQVEVDELRVIADREREQRAAAEAAA